MSLRAWVVVNQLNREMSQSRESESEAWLDYFGNRGFAEEYQGQIHEAVEVLKANGWACIELVEKEGQDG